MFVVVVPAEAEATFVYAKLNVPFGVLVQVENLNLYSLVADVSTSLITPPTVFPGESVVIGTPKTTVVAACDCTVALYSALLISPPLAVNLKTATL